ncbi:MAG: hypothetical protein HY077_10815 [Elusimicrobia bacterium]|nr:hypothetical protein [Elusimicrobiota bacterium]
MSVVRDWQEVAGMACAEGAEVLVLSSNLRYRVMAGRWVCVGCGAG